MPELDNSRILVIGGAGFVGSHIVDQLLEEPVREIVVIDNFVRGTRENLSAAVADERVTLVEGSLLDTELLRELMTGTDYAFHLAALWLYECVHEPRSAVEVNIVGTFNVIEAAQAAGVKKVVYSSSASVYGDALETPMTEEHPFNNRTTYGATKIAGRTALPRLQRAARPRLRRPPLHERLRPADGLQGHVRQRDHEGARQDRGWRGAPDLRGRLAGVRLRSRLRRRPRQHPGAEERRDGREPQRRHRRQDDDQGAGRRPAPDHGLRRRAGVPARRSRCSSPTG